MANSRDIKIPAAQWADFLQTFTDQHQGWLVTVTVASGPRGSIRAADSRLQNIVLIEAGDRFSIPISVLGPKGPHVVCEVTDPAELTFKLDPRGAHEGLEITAADHSLTVVHFRVPVLPETLDGVLPEVWHGKGK